MTYLPALHRQFCFVSDKLFRIDPLAQGGEDAQEVNLEYLLVSILGRSSSSRGSTGQPLFDNPTASSGTAYLCAGEGEGDENLWWK